MWTRCPTASSSIWDLWAFVVKCSATWAWARVFLNLCGGWLLSWDISELGWDATAFSHRWLIQFSSLMLLDFQSQSRQGWLPLSPLPSEASSWLCQERGERVWFPWNSSHSGPWIGCSLQENCFPDESCQILVYSILQSIAFFGMLISVLFWGLRGRTFDS